MKIRARFLRRCAVVFFAIVSRDLAMPIDCADKSGNSSQPVLQQETQQSYARAQASAEADERDYS